MDHIPSPLEGGNPAIDVPLKCTGTIRINCGQIAPEAAADSFSSFPEEVGWSIELLLLGDLQDRSGDEAIAFIQEWLFFGVLYHVLGAAGVRVRHEDFIRKDAVDGSYWVTTDLLPQYMETWKAEKDTKTREQAESQLYAIRRILLESAAHVKRLNFMSATSGFRWPGSDEIMLSILVLGSTLDYTRMNIYKDVAEQPDHILLRTASWLIQDRLLARGCCPNHVSMLEQTLTPATVYYAYRMDALEHTKDHSRCSEETCIADNVDEGTYITQHYDTCDGLCGSVEPPIEKALAILDAGGYPLISVLPAVRAMDEADVDLVAATPDIPYVAISHVWADGLGNPHRNSLPRCQFFALRAMVQVCLYDKDGQPSRLHNGRLHFWLDTICVPLRPPHRGKAIKLMARTYTAATQVLVLDRQIRQLTWKPPFAAQRYEEHLIRITCCSWLRRLWTFQEGVLAKRLYFWCDDGACEVGVWILQHIRDRSRELWNIVGMEVINFNLLMRRLLRIDGAERVAHVWSALQWRTTSRAADELICVAALLGLDLGPLVDAPPERRMDVFLELQQFFPPGIIFASGPRLEAPGRRWAPASFMASQGNEYAVLDSGALPAYFDERGLFVEYPGLRLHVARTPLTAPCLVLDEGTRSCFQLSWAVTDDERLQQRIGAADAQALMVVLHRPPDGTRADIPGILVAVRDTDGEEGCLYVDYWCNVRVSQEPAEAWEQNWAMYLDECTGTFDEYLCARCSLLDSTQQWCIG
ncbi:hypothetical protein BFW01_g10061 [Lasiodiplodia theobromae]|nr:hypothetical protein BFW01_g10061 [Lasiodiplodia theobromae]